MFPMQYKIVLNTNNDLIAGLTEKTDDEELRKMFARQVYDMALMNMRQLTPEELGAFENRTVEIMQKLL